MLTLLRAEINSEACQSGEAGAIFIPAQICTEAISRSLWKMHLQHEREESFSIPGSQSATCADAISSRVSNACSSLKWKKGERWYSRMILRGKWPDVATDGAFPPLVSDKKREKSNPQTTAHFAFFPSFEDKLRVRAQRCGSCHPGLVWLLTGLRWCWWCGWGWRWGSCHQQSLPPASSCDFRLARTANEDTLVSQAWHECSHKQKWFDLSLEIEASCKFVGEGGQGVNCFHV